MASLTRDRNERRFTAFLSQQLGDRRVVKLWPPEDGIENHNDEFNGFKVLGLPPVGVVVQERFLRDSSQLAALLENREFLHKLRLLKRAEAVVVLMREGRVAISVEPFYA